MILRRKKLKQSGCRTQRVGNKPPNPFGLFDMEGNVAEWCCDFFSPIYSTRKLIENPIGPPIGTTYVARGGNYLSVASAIQPWQRSNVVPIGNGPAKYDSLGVRVLCEIGRVQHASPELAKADRKIGRISDKTLIAWVQLTHLSQRGGAAIVICQELGIARRTFDAIVFGEVVPNRWMAGSDMFRRTQRDQSAYPIERAAHRRFVQVAITYRGNVITIYRDGVQYAQYTITAPAEFGPDHRILIGLRIIHFNGPLAGVIEEARIYDRALDPQTIAALEPNKVSTPPPLGMWTFEDGTALDVMGTYKKSVMYGAARIENGKLYLDGKTAFVECFLE